MRRVIHTYQVRPRKDRRGFDLISDALPFGRLWYQDADAAIGYAKFFSRSYSVEIRVFNVASEVIDTQTSDCQFREL